MPIAYRLVGATGIHKGDRHTQQDQVALLSHPRVAGCVLAVLADGIGGRTGGRKAADQVLLTAQQLFERYVPSTDDGAKLLAQLVEESHTMIRLTAISAAEEPHSTLAAFLINASGDCHWVHAGDSRIYHFRRGRLVTQTRDHSYVQSLVDKGTLQLTDAAQHPESHVLLGCVGGDKPPPQSAHFIRKLVPGDVLLACSDGLWHHFTSAELGRIVHELPPREASEFLVEKARTRAAGQGDNLSLVIVKIAPIVAEPSPAG